MTVTLTRYTQIEHGSVDKVNWKYEMQNSLKILLEHVKKYGDDIHAYRELGRVNVKKDGDLLIFNYHRQG